VGTTALHLIDKARPDPVAGPGHFRELMTSVWYPARNVGRHPPAPWMSPAPMRGLLASGDFAEDAALAPVTAGHLGAPVRSTIGRLTVPLFELPMYPGDFARDIRFVLDRVEDLAAGRNPDVDHQPLPAGLGAALDLDRVGMFGWSKGATATALVMGADPRVRAGLSFDGPMESDPPSSGRT
jgi:hypothetical protein